MDYVIIDTNEEDILSTVQLPVQWPHHLTLNPGVIGTLEVKKEPTSPVGNPASSITLSAHREVTTMEAGEKDNSPQADTPKM